MNSAVCGLGVIIYAFHSKTVKESIFLTPPYFVELEADTSFQVVLVIVALIVGIELSPRGSVKENTSLSIMIFAMMC